MLLVMSQRSYLSTVTPLLKMVGGRNDGHSLQLPDDFKQVPRRPSILDRPAAEGRDLQISNPFRC